MRRASRRVDGTGRIDLGRGPALNHGGDVMRRMPFSVTLMVKKTRTGWSIAVRVVFAS